VQSFGGDFSTLLLYMLVLTFVGACGGAVLWLSLRDRKDRRAVSVALLSAVGFFLGSFIVVGLFFFLSFMQVGYTLLEALRRGGNGPGRRCAVGVCLFEEAGAQWLWR
jgi:hypothetical protein